MESGTPGSRANCWSAASGAAVVAPTAAPHSSALTKTASFVFFIMISLLEK
jgi:hypothetical protein